MKQYLKLCKYVLKNGKVKGDRTGTGTISAFSPPEIRCNLKKGFPIVTTKKIYTKGWIEELLWFLKGDTNIKYLVEHNVHIWDDWRYAAFQKSDEYQGETKKEFAQKIIDDEGFAERWGDAGDIYGKQWRRWEAADGRIVDQISNVIEMIKHNPDSRRLLVVSFNPGEISTADLPACHSLFQFYVVNNTLSCKMFQRSGDVFLGIPFNISSYALLTMMVAHVCGLKLGELVLTITDAHIYSNHVEQVKLQLTREPKKLPKMIIKRKVDSIFDFKAEDFELVGYDPHPAIKGDVSV